MKDFGITTRSMAFLEPLACGNTAVAARFSAAITPGGRVLQLYRRFLSKRFRIDHICMKRQEACPGLSGPVRFPSCGRTV